MVGEQNKNGMERSRRLTAGKEGHKRNWIALRKKQEKKEVYKEREKKKDNWEVRTGRVWNLGCVLEENILT